MVTHFKPNILKNQAKQKSILTETPAYPNQLDEDNTLLKIMKKTIIPSVFTNQ